MSKPTLTELDEQQAERGKAFRDAKDRLGQDRDRARTAIGVLADLEVRALSDDPGSRPDRETIQSARMERQAALEVLQATESELRPERDDLGVRAESKR